jgi:hypothetical protein
MKRHTAQGTVEDVIDGLTKSAVQNAKKLIASTQCAAYITQRQGHTVSYTDDVAWAPKNLALEMAEMHLEVCFLEKDPTLDAICWLAPMIRRADSTKNDALLILVIRRSAPLFARVVDASGNDITTEYVEEVAKYGVSLFGTAFTNLDTVMQELLTSSHVAVPKGTASFYLPANDLSADIDNVVRGVIEEGLKSVRNLMHDNAELIHVVVRQRYGTHHAYRTAESLGSVSSALELIDALKDSGEIIAAAVVMPKHKDRICVYTTTAATYPEGDAWFSSLRRLFKERIDGKKDPNSLH